MTLHDENKSSDRSNLRRSASECFLVFGCSCSCHLRTCEAASGRLSCGCVIAVTKIFVMIHNRLAVPFFMLSMETSHKIYVVLCGTTPVRELIIGGASPSEEIIIIIAAWREQHGVVIPGCAPRLRLPVYTSFCPPKALIGVLLALRYCALL